jgi:creatinine amidohydrolase
MKSIIITFLIHCALTCVGQVQFFKELTTTEVQAMDPNKTAIIIPGGLMEEHGPYLPLYTDGYTNEKLARMVADTIYTKLKFNVLIFPTVPLGVGSPESFGKIKSYPGVVYLKPATLRLVFMDIADMLGGQGFKWIFVVFKHGDSDHNLVLNQACDYFNDSYKGKMITLTAVEYDTWQGRLPAQSSAQSLENGIDIHAGMDETSRMLFNVPTLVKSDYIKARPMPAHSWDDFPVLTRSADWQGYYGSPRLATKEFGEIIMNKFSHNLSELAIKIISGFDPASLPRVGERSKGTPGAIRELTSDIDIQQKRWLKAKGIE